jgi:hypothetical protein
MLLEVVRPEDNAIIDDMICMLVHFARFIVEELDLTCFISIGCHFSSN